MTTVDKNYNPIGPDRPKKDIDPRWSIETPEIGYQAIIIRTTLLIFLLTGIILIIFGIHQTYLANNPAKIGYIYTIIGAIMLFIREYIYYYYYVDKYKDLI